MAGAIETRSTVTLAVLKQRLRIDGTAEDALLSVILAGVKNAADNWCKSTFLDAEGEDLPIPSALELWILGRAVREYQHPENGATAAAVPGVYSVTLGAEDKKLIGGFWRPAGT